MASCCFSIGNIVAYKLKGLTLNLSKGGVFTDNKLQVGLMS